MQGCVKQDYTYIKKLQTVILCKKHQQWRKKQFWKTMKYLRREQSTIPTLQLDGKCADNELDKAKI